MPETTCSSFISQTSQPKQRPDLHKVVSLFIALKAHVQANYVQALPLPRDGDSHCHGATRDANVAVGTAPVGNLFCPAMEEWSWPVCVVAMPTVELALPMAVPLSCMLTTPACRLSTIIGHFAYSMVTRVVTFPILIIILPLPLRRVHDWREHPIQKAQLKVSCACKA
jgi:fumarate reductase subunit D